ncbi:MAG: Crp/Fnr family transcriptional regulator [Rubrivivax sp.]|jgi:CRP-like cAMP-binding protein|nr:Crp/Fnr family transcriptional regulator [Rubrivivax sp.]
MQTSMRPSEAVSALAERPLPSAARGVPSTGRGTGFVDAASVDARAWNALLGAPQLSAAELQALGSIARMRTVAAGAPIFGHHEPATALVGLRVGEAALGYRGGDGVFHIERPVRAPGWLDQSSAWLDATHAIDACATTEVVVVELPREALQQQMVTHPLIAQRLVVSLAREVQSLSVNTHELMHKDAPARFAAWLVQRCNVLDAAGLRGTVRLSERKRDIASQLAITPETLSRLMRSLSRKGLISVAGYTLQVLDLPALRAVAAGD